MLMLLHRTSLAHDVRTALALPAATHARARCSSGMHWAPVTQGGRCNALVVVLLAEASLPSMPGLPQLQH